MTLIQNNILYIASRSIENTVFIADKNLSGIALKDLANHYLDLDYEERGDISIKPAGFYDQSCAVFYGQPIGQEKTCREFLDEQRDYREYLRLKEKFE